MACRHCQSTATAERAKKTRLGYRTFACRSCRRTFNARAGTPFNLLEYPTDLVFLVVVWRLRYKLSLRDLAEMFLARGFVFTHETVRDWEARFALLLIDQLRQHRRGKVGRHWHVDETYVRVKGRWCYLYRAIDRDGNLIDSMLSEHHDMDAAKRFFRRAKQQAAGAPEQVTTDKHGSYPRAVRTCLGRKVVHRCSQYKNNRIEQDHRGVKQRYRPMRGFGAFASAARFCVAFDEVRQWFRPQTTMNQAVSLAERRRLVMERFQGLKTLVGIA